MIHILLVDDHPAVGQGTKQLIEQDPEMIVTIAEDGLDALRLLQKHKFDVCLYDLHMPIINGLALSQQTSTINPDLPILIYTGFDIASNYNVLIEAGVSGFLDKTAKGQKIVNSIRYALEGETIIPIDILRQLRRTDSVKGADDRSIEDVSINSRERELLKLIVDGRSNKEIAELQHMSQRTVEYHLTRIFNKLKVASRSEAAAKAKQLKLLADFII